jgi:hypothetical protein
MTVHLVTVPSLLQRGCFYVVMGLAVIINNFSFSVKVHLIDERSVFHIPESFSGSSRLSPEPLLQVVLGNPNKMRTFENISEYYLRKVPDGITDLEIVDAIEQFFWGMTNGYSMEIGALDGSPDTRSMTYDLESS